MIKQNVVYLYHEIPFSNKKEHLLINIMPWIELKNVMLYHLNRLYCMIPFM